MEEPIQSFPIHSLPESLILECLARLHLKDLPVATRVCRKWLHLIGSRHFYTLRKQLGYTNQVACFLQQCIPPPTDDPNSPKHIYRINILDPINREWTRLPPIPNYPNKLLWSASITSFEGKLIVFGDSNRRSHDAMKASKAVYVLDFATQRWRKGKGMPLIKRYRFSMAASQCHRIFICSREKGPVWEYDVWKDEWSVLHQVKDGFIMRVQVIGEELWVIIVYKAIKKLNRLKEHGAEVYHLKTKKWRKVLLSSEELEELMCTTDFELYEFMKKLCQNNLTMVVQECHRLQLGKQSLLMAPTVTTTIEDDTYNGREELFYMQDQDGNMERIQTSSSDFSGLVASFCCVEL